MKKITNESLFELKNVSQPLVEGNRIFYLETQMNQEKNSYETALYSYDQRDNSISEWGNAGSNYSQLAISSDHRYLTFVSSASDNEKAQLFKQPLSGGAAVQVTFEEKGISNVLLGQEGDFYYQVTVEAEKEEEKFPQPTVVTDVTYKLDGVGLLSKVDSYQLKRGFLDKKEGELLFEQTEAFHVSYVSKDGSYMIYQQERTTRADFAFGLTSLYRYSFQSKQQDCLTESLANGSFSLAAVNPKEDFYLLVGNEFEYAFVTLERLYGYDVTTGQLTCLTKNLDYSIADEIVADFQQNVRGFVVEWLDDRSFIFAASEEGKTTLYKGNREGAVEKLVDRPLHLTDSNLGVGLEQLVVTYSTPTIPSRLALLNVERQELTDLVNPNVDFETQYSIVEPEKIWVKGYEQWDIQGWYLPPVEYQNHHPAVLYVHGGPQVNYGESFFHEVQVLANLGYGVIMLNPRGGSSYGQRFVASILGDYGNHDYDDLMMGTDQVLAQHPEIDPQRLYLAGGSYGGFMTNWIVGHTDRFKAAVAQRCISNWISFYGTSDIGPFFVSFQLQNDLDNMEELWRMSPLAYAQQVKTPLLLLHGESDKRCPQEQAEQMYMAMKKRGVDTKLITYPESSHGLSREGLPNLRMARLQAIQDWFQEH